MARRRASPSLGSALCLLLVGLTQSVSAVPYAKDDLHDAGYGYLMPRQCDQYCGYNNMYCCSAGSTCYTTDGKAACSVANGGGGYAWYTTTWTSTETFTRTYSSIIPAATAASGNCVPPEGSGQIACGRICCASWQYCAYSGQCMANIGGGGGGGGVGATTFASGGQVVTTQFSAPYRVTSGASTAVVVTGTAASATTTSGAVSPGGGGTSGSLSAGAIAGIVIGTLAGIVLLLLICACCIVRGLWHGVLALLGLGKKKKTETIIEEERYSRSGSRHSRRDNHGSWYGGRPATVASRKEKSSGKGLLGMGAALGTLWLLLGLRKDKKKPAAKTRSDVSSSYWSDSYTADSPSELSSNYYSSSLSLTLYRLNEQRQADPSLTPQQDAKQNEQGDENNTVVAGAFAKVTAQVTIILGLGSKFDRVTIYDETLYMSTLSAFCMVSHEPSTLGDSPFASRHSGTVYKHFPLVTPTPSPIINSAFHELRSQAQNSFPVFGIYFSSRLKECRSQDTIE